MYGGAWTWLSRVAAKNIDGKFYTKDTFKSSNYVETPTHKVTVSRTIQLTQDFITANATVNRVQLLYKYIPVGANTKVTNLKIEPAKNLNSTATPYMPSASEVTTADWPKYIGFSNTVKTNKSASDYTWFPVKDSELTNKVDSHINNKSNPHSVTASQVGAYSKTEADSKLALKANDSDVVHNTGDETIAGKKSFTDDMSVSNLKVTGAISTVNDIPLTKVTNWNSGWSGNAYYKVRNGQVTLVFQGVSTPAIAAAGSAPFAVPGLNFSVRTIVTNGYIVSGGATYPTKISFTGSSIIISALDGTSIAAQTGGLWLTTTQEII